jgi:hypothetical protein
MYELSEVEPLHPLLVAFDCLNGNILDVAIRFGRRFSDGDPK